MLKYDYNFYNFYYNTNFNNKFFNNELDIFIDEIQTKILYIFDNNLLLKEQVLNIYKDNYLFLEAKNNKFNDEEIKLATKMFIYSIIFYYNIDGYEFIKDNFILFLNLFNNNIDNLSNIFTYLSI